MLLIGTDGGNGAFILSGSGVLAPHKTFAEIVGDNSTGTFTQNGGTNTTSAGLTLGAFAGSSGTHNLNGGLLTLFSLSGGSGSGDIRLQWRNNVRGDIFLTNLPLTLGTSGGGGTLDTAGFSVTLAGSLSGRRLTLVDSGTLVLTTSGPIPDPQPLTKENCWLTVRWSARWR